MSKGSERYPRFDTGQRIEHGLLVLSFTILSITGLPQKYPDTGWGEGMIWLMGGIELTRFIHHTAAIVLIVGSIYHLASVGYRLVVKRVQMSMMPGWKDVVDVVQTLGHNFGLIKEAPKMGRYTFGEKVEYWAVVWGTVIMILTGFMLWNPIATSRLLPGEFIPAAKAAHGGEALLAVLSIVTWHLYNVHVKSFNKSMFSGYLSRHEMEEEHPLELADREKGEQKTIAPALLRQRRRLYLPVAVLFSLVLLISVYFFVTFEATAITTVPRQTMEIFAPANR
ncbi:MAG: cytochrome b/b6 domain-containing protein [Caldilineaceae bacterium]|nr:cytochrome b/b6 domain-containing protein [Caldilineaceae bacterium]HRJ41716.1 cytochrome b/b6 domain-containing protein [Caldilineaceae bacterium]